MAARLCNQLCKRNQQIHNGKLTRKNSWNSHNNESS